MSVYTRAYSRGYSAGSRHSWPEHCPPLPPDPICRDLTKSLMAARDQLDYIQSIFDEEEEPRKRVLRALDAANASLIAVSRWLKQQAAPPTAGDGAAP